MNDTFRAKPPLLDAVFWDYPKFRDEVFLRDYLKRNHGNSGYQWAMTRFLEHGRVADAFMLFSISEIATYFRQLRPRWILPGC